MLVSIAAIAVIVALGWVWTKFTETAEGKASDLADKTFYATHRRAASRLGSGHLRIRTTVPSELLWNELAFRLPLSPGKPRFAESLYIAGELPSSTPGHYGMRVNWNDCIQSAIVVFRESDSETVCEHAMLQWVESGHVMRQANAHFEALRCQLVTIVRALDPHARATIVEGEREVTFVPQMGNSQSTEPGR